MLTYDSQNLDTFLQSFESESQVIDVTRAAAFLQKVSSRVT